MLNPEDAWTAVEEFSTREYHAPIREGEEETVDTWNAKGEPAKISKYERRQDEMAALWEMSQRAKGDSPEAKTARRECYEWTIKRTHESIGRRGAPTIEEALVLLDTTPKA